MIADIQLHQNLYRTSLSPPAHPTCAKRHSPTSFMVVMCSPHRDAGGPIQFLSPTHIHHVDATSALKQLRHSLSRSPSKGPTFRFLTSKSASPSPSSPLSPSPLSPPNRSASTNLLLCSTFASPSSWAIPYPPSARKNRLVARKVSPMRTSSRSRNSPHSPVRTALADSTDHGNATPSSSADSSDDVENSYTRDHPSEKTNSDSAFKANVFGPSETYLAPLSALPKLDKGSGSSGSYLAKSSPLKRSDGIMNLDQANLGSPSAKRRSLHGGSFSPDFDIFDHEAASLAHFEPRNTSDGSSLDNPTSSEYHNVFSPMQKRTSSLRKTTLQQRYEKPTFARSKPNTDLALDFTTPGQVAAKGRNRMSLDGVVPSIPRDSPFSSQSSLPNASVHPMSQQSLGFHNQVHPPRHPLSRTITQSSSSSSMAEDSPTHIPHRQPDTRKAIVDFSKSLPVGAARPTPAEPVTSGPTSQTSSSGTSFATPDNYKLAKPLPAAFMSTGLISKRNKNMDDSRLGLHDSRSHMPDTPCKRPISMVVATPVAVPESAIGRARQVRHSFGTPSTPFGQHVARPAPEIFGKGVSIFGGSFGTRRGSFVSVDGEELLQSPSAKVDSQSSNDFDFPPTPTKQVLGSEDAQPQAGDSVLRATNHQSRASASMGTKSPGPGLNCKLVLVGKPSGSVDGDSDSVMDDSPSAALSSRSYSSIPSSFTHSRSLRNSKSPTPLSKKSYTAPSLLQLHKFRTKPSPQSPASPIQDRFEHLAPRTPHTPHENMIPPDPSGLSISANVDGHANRSLGDVRVNALSFPPATPTASKDYFSHFGKSRSSITPIHGFSSTDVDPSLTSRFERVELIGTGEFSQVYRVTQKSDPNMASKYFPLSMTHASPKTPMPDRVWAVKKSRHAYVGGRDRQRKLQEVTVLKALGQADHTVCLFDNWEEKNHLYIQTEFCEEGSLDMFLDQVGRKARLDDFRIWKIMLELSQVGPQNSFERPSVAKKTTGSQAHP